MLTLLHADSRSRALVLLQPRSRQHRPSPDTIATILASVNRNLFQYFLPLQPYSSHRYSLKIYRGVISAAALFSRGVLYRGCVLHQALMLCHTVAFCFDYFAIECAIIERRAYEARGRLAQENISSAYERQQPAGAPRVKRAAPLCRGAAEAGERCWCWPSGSGHALPGQ